MGITTKRILTDTIIAGADLAAHVFVARDGTLPAAGARPWGVTLTEADDEAPVAVDVIGIVLATSAEAIAQGDVLAVDGTGKVTANGGLHQLVVDGAAADTDIDVTGLLAGSEILGIINLTDNAQIAANTITVADGSFETSEVTSNKKLLVTWHNAVVGIARTAASAADETIEVLVGTYQGA